MKKKKKDPKQRRFYFKFVTFVFALMLLTYMVVGVVLFLFERFNIIDLSAPGRRLPPFLLISFFVLGALVFGLIITSITATIFLKPINELSNATKRVAKGDFSVRIKNEEHESEMGELIANFNQMVSDLAQIETLKNDFISNVSHEFKTPLTTIQGYSTLLQDENLSSEERQAYTQYIIDATKQLSSMTSNILKLSKLENQRGEIETTRFDAAEQIRQAILFLETQWSVKDIDLDINLDSAEIEANSELMMQVWMNVIGNAIKYSDYAGKIIVRATVVEGRYRVMVKDFGCGMDEQTVRRVFEKFYQGDNSHSKEGNGLGMALVKKILDISGGRITVRSQPGVGTAFVISVPVAAAKQKTPQIA